MTNHNLRQVAYCLCGCSALWFVVAFFNQSHRSPLLADTVLQQIALIQEQQASNSSMQSAAISFVLSFLCVCVLAPPTFFTAAPTQRAG